jgi:hypothetical protein
MESIKCEKIIALLNDEAFIDNLQSIESVEGLRDAFAANGVDLSVEETMAVIKTVGVHSQEDELDEKGLEEVAGGISVYTVLKGMWKGFKAGWKLGSKFYDWEKKILG